MSGLIEPSVPLSHYRLWDLPAFGLLHLSVSEAAELTVVDMWFSGEITDIEEPPDFDGDTSDPRLLASLAEQRDTFKARLLASIEAGHLGADVVSRDYDDRLKPDETYIACYALDKWLEARGYESGDIFTEWYDMRGDMVGNMQEEASFCRTATRQELKKHSLSKLAGRCGVELDDMDRVDMSVAYDSAILEVQKLRKALSSHSADKQMVADRPLTTRQRRTLLTVIAALCKEAGIDYQERGTAKRISIAVSELGAAVGEDTIRGYLSAIPDAVESRSK